MSFFFLVSIFTIRNINNVAEIYKTPKYGSGPNGGNVQDILDQEYTSSVVYYS